MAKNISRPGTRNKDAGISMNRISLKQVETSERFYRVPKALLLNPAYKEMRAESKMVYAILKDRLELSIQNNRVDENGDVFLNYSIKSLEELLGFGKNKIIGIKKELQAYGLIEEERQGLNKANRIYVGEVVPQNEVIHRAEPVQDKEVSKSNFRKFKNQTTRGFKIKPQEVSKQNSNDTELSDTNLSDTEINKTDDDEKLNNISNLSNSTQNGTNPLIQTGHLLEKNIELRPIVHKLIPDLLINDTSQALEVVNALVSAKQYLYHELESGNTVLKQRQMVRGQDCITSLIEEISSKQLAYMNDNLVNSNHYGQYFQKGLNQRLKIAITTDKFVAGY